jgi:small subunit ribosomal protein S2e
LQFAGLEDVFTASRGSTKTLGNFVMATFAAVHETFTFLTPDLWKPSELRPSPYEEYSDVLAVKKIEESY